MKKNMMLVLAACTAAFFLAGCGSGDTSRSGASDVGAPGEKEIMMWLVGSEGQAQTIIEIAKEFYKNTKVRVRCEAISWGEAHSKYLTSIAGGVAPDIGTMGLTWGAEFGNLGAMVDLSREYPEDVSKIKTAVFPGMWNSIEHKGSVYGIPFDITEYIMYYRNDIIPAPPTTWEELAILLTDLNKKDKSMLFDWGSMSWIGYSNYLWQAGGDFYSPDYKRVTIDSAEGLAGLKFFTDLYTKYKVPKAKILLE